MCALSFWVNLYCNQPPRGDSDGFSFLLKASHKACRYLKVNINTLVKLFQLASLYQVVSKLYLGIFCEGCTSLNSINLSSCSYKWITNFFLSQDMSPCSSGLPLKQDWAHPIWANSPRLIDHNQLVTARQTFSVETKRASQSEDTRLQTWKPFVMEMQFVITCRITGLRIINHNQQRGLWNLQKGRKIL